MWVVAELGVNHDGDPRKLLQLVEAAAESGADAVKLQVFSPERLLSGSAELAGYQKSGADDARGLLAGLAMPGEANRQAAELARSKGLGLVATPFSPQDVAELEALGLDAVKIASPDCVNPVLLRAAAGLGLPMLVSTGAADLEEVSFAAEWMRGEGGPGSDGHFRGGGALLHCVSSYPTPDALAGLGGVAALRDRYGLPVGYSDHTPATDTGALATACGAVVLEKHLTLDRTAPGPDHRASQDPDGFAEYVANVRRAERMVGPITKQVTPIERDVRRVARQSVAAARDLEAGRVLTADDLTVMRPGTGIPAMRFEDCIGRALNTGVKRGELLPTALLDG